MQLEGPSTGNNPLPCPLDEVSTPLPRWPFNSIIPRDEKSPYLGHLFSRTFRIPSTILLLLLFHFSPLPFLASNAILLTSEKLFPFPHLLEGGGFRNKGARPWIYIYIYKLGWDGRECETQDGAIETCRSELWNKRVRARGGSPLHSPATSGEAGWILGRISISNALIPRNTRSCHYLLARIPFRPDRHPFPFVSSSFCASPLAAKGKEMQFNAAETERETCFPDGFLDHAYETD